MTAVLAGPPPSADATHVDTATATTWDRRETSSVGLNGEAINLPLDLTALRESVAPGKDTLFTESTTVLRDNRIANSTEVRLTGTERVLVRGENWGADLSGSKLHNLDHKRGNFKGAVLFNAEIVNNYFDASCVADGISIIKSNIVSSNLPQNGRIGSLRESVVSIDCEFHKLGLIGTDMRGLRFTGVGGRGEPLTAGQMFQKLVEDHGEKYALKVFRELFKGSIYDGTTLMDGDLRAILDKVSKPTKKTKEGSIKGVDGLFNELDNSSHFANEREAHSKRTRDGKSYVIELQDRDSLNKARITVQAVDNPDRTTNRFTVKYEFDGEGMDMRFLSAASVKLADGREVKGRNWDPAGSEDMTAEKAFLRTLSIVRETERQFQRLAGGTRAVGDDVLDTEAEQTKDAGETREIDESDNADTGIGEAAVALAKAHSSPAGSSLGTATTPEEKRQRASNEILDTINEYNLKVSEENKIPRQLRDLCARHFAKLIDPVSGELVDSEIGFIRGNVGKDELKISFPDGEIIVAAEHKKLIAETLGKLVLEFNKPFAPVAMTPTAAPAPVAHTTSYSSPSGEDPDEAARRGAHGDMPVTMA